MRLNQVRVPHVAHAKQEAQGAVAERNASMLAEDQRGGSLFRPRHLGKDQAGHERLDQQSADCLRTQGHYDTVAFCGDVSVDVQHFRKIANLTKFLTEYVGKLKHQQLPLSISNRVLSFNRKKEHRNEIGDVGNTRFPAGVVEVLEVTVLLA